ISAQQKSSATTTNPASEKTTPTSVDGAVQRPGLSAEKSETSRPLSPAKIRTRISEVKRLMRSRPSLTAMTSPALDYVTLAALQPETGNIHLLTLSKESFLTRGAELSLTTSLGTPVQLRIVRA